MARFLALLALLAGTASAQTIELREYGKEAQVSFPIHSNNGQNYVSTAPCMPGDVKLTKDGAAPVNLPCFAQVTGNLGYYSISLSAADLQAKELIITLKDTAPKAWLDDSVKVHTYGHVLAMHPFLISLTPAPEPPKPVTERAVFFGTVNSSATTASGFEALVTDSARVAVTDIPGKPNDRSILWITGALARQTYTVQNDSPAGSFVSLSVSVMSSAPAAGDQFIVQ